MPRRVIDWQDNGLPRTQAGTKVKSALSGHGAIIFGQFDFFDNLVAGQQVGVDTAARRFQSIKNAKQVADLLRSAQKAARPKNKLSLPATLLPICYHQPISHFSAAVPQCPEFWRPVMSIRAVKLESHAQPSMESLGVHLH
ncbi:hypothetical protein [Nisaea sp.]|uniref:hypothetical protein n=1 Tax=Nisaea sp. TaxID=2024842 RepID=UPI003298B039